MKNVIIAILVALLVVAGFMIVAKKKANVAYEPWPETEPATATTPKPKPMSPVSSTPTQTNSTTINNNQNGSNTTSVQTNINANLPTCNSNSPQSVTVLSPNGGEVYSRGQNMTIKWQSCNNSTSQKVSVSLWDIKNNYYYITGASSGYSTTDNGSFTFDIPESLFSTSTNNTENVATNFTSGKNFKVKVTFVPVEENKKEDASDSYFAIN